MSTEHRCLVKEYDGKWEINKWFHRTQKSAYFATPVISPISSDNIQLHFELKWDFFRSSTDSGSMFSCLELRIFRHSRSVRPPDVIEVFISIYYSDGRLLHECISPFPMKVAKLFNCCFDRQRFEVDAPNESYPPYFTDHNRRLKNNNFTLRCHLDMYDYRIPRERILLSNLKNFNRKMCSMYEKKILSDFRFKIGDKFLHTHKATLSAHSTVLARMVSSDFIESKTGLAVITDCSYETFDSFLRYLYSGEIITPSWQNLLELYIIADKYDVSLLKEECAEHLINTLDSDRIKTILYIAYFFSDSRLIRETKKIQRRF